MPGFIGAISSMVREPRRVLREFGLDLDDNVEIAVHDSSSEVRYMVLPERPAGTEGATEEEVQSRLWQDPRWRRIRVEDGGLRADEGAVA